jgi:CheY-like chemotaxis protein
MQSKIKKGNDREKQCIGPFLSFSRKSTEGGKAAMTSESPLKDKSILVVDDEPDVLETVEEELDMCIIRKATDYDTAIQYLSGYTFDIVILDIMGVNGFELLKDAVSRGFPTVMLTAHALSPESLKKSIKLGAVSFLPKEKIPELKSFLEDVVIGDGNPVWRKLFDKLGSYFQKRFGPDWQEQDKFFKEFIEALKEDIKD